MADLVDTLGVPLEDVLRSPHVLALQTRPQIMLVGDRFHMDLPEHGIAFVASLDGKVSSVQLHAAGHEGYEQFDGDLPEGVRFSDSREMIRARLGQPNTIGGGQHLGVLGIAAPWDRFDRADHAIHIQYSKDGLSITLVSLMRPDAVPK
jgi:hypothetical protein